jgi:hypothetical protein
LPDDLVTRPTVGAVEAVKLVFAFLQKRKVIPASWRVRAERVFENAALANGPAFVELKRGVDGPVRLHLEVCPLPSGRAVLAWVLAFALKDGRRFQALVTATGRRRRVLTVSQTNSCAFHADWVPTPGTTKTADTFPQAVFATPDGKPRAASTWQAVSGFAAGANVICSNTDAPAAEALGTLDVDNVFVWTNFLHDMFGAFGFDAAHHAFEDSDPLNVTRHKTANKAAGDFDNFADGVSPEMRLFKSPHSGGVHAGSDPSVVIHEYVHGVSSRLVGGVSVSVPFTSREAQGFSEGLSDYFALTVLNWVARAHGQTTTVTRFGEMFQPANGIRDYTSFTDVLPKKMPKDIYRIGAIWCAGLLDGRRSVAVQVSEDDADRFVWQALIDALKMLAHLAPPQNGVTLANAKQTLLLVGGRIESLKPSLSGATALMDSALTARRI